MLWLTLIPQGCFAPQPEEGEKEATKTKNEGLAFVTVLGLTKIKYERVGVPHPDATTEGWEISEGGREDCASLG